jgi:hypothetical protein
VRYVLPKKAKELFQCIPSKKKPTNINMKIIIKKFFKLNLFIKLTIVSEKKAKNKVVIIQI